MVSPSARPSPRMIAPKIPGRALRRTAMRSISHFVAPSARAASRCIRGTAVTTSRVMEAMMGRIMMARIMPAASIPYPYFGPLNSPVQPKYFGWTGLFSGPKYGYGMLAAGMILAIMILPIIASITREVVTAVPRMQREAALALGATKWEMLRMAVLRNARPGILGAIILGLGRALGETMAVYMLIGNRAQIVRSLFAPGNTLASVIAAEFTEAVGNVYLSSLIEMALVLFVLTLIVNALAGLLVWSITRGMPARALA